MGGIATHALAFGLASACGDHVEPTAVCAAELGAALIYGEDQRRDVRELFDSRPEELAQLALESAVALMAEESLVETQAGSYVVQAETLGERFNLCSSERFVTQPTAALCSGVLVASDLVLTAAHCAAALPCEAQRWVFNYALATPDRLADITTDDVYRCSALPFASQSSLDYAFVALDRRVAASHRPASLHPRLLELGAMLSVIGFPHGLPLKVATGARVLDAQSSALNTFSLDSDTSTGNSGSGVFDDRGALVGLFLRGAHDWVLHGERGRECIRTKRVAQASDPARAEQAGYLQPALDTLCSSPWLRASACDPPLAVERDCVAPNAGAMP